MFKKTFKHQIILRGSNFASGVNHNFALLILIEKRCHCDARSNLLGFADC